MSIKVLINASTRYPVNRKKIRDCVNKALGEFADAKEIEVSILFCGDRLMTKLNEVYLKRKGTTDVLSFPLKETKYPDNVLRLGDIIISYPQARKQASERNHLVDEEIDKLVNHGILSLLGLEE